ncbi:MgtC/SapB family protein [Streptomyces sp. NPDC086787]|uniref:MgtC/SapB family protein n=1 Tax=Streptomyces sp. NPDC086787 TaxID=3365759 RepID=UPI0038281D4A
MSRMVMMALLGEPSGQGWQQVAEFGLALLLSGAIGVERELRQKAAGLRTYTIVGVGAALFTLVSKYGFTDVLSAGTVVLDPSRVTAQIVSGLGFIGGGVIFFHGMSVRGLNTAATIWLTAAIGCAAAAGLPVLAVMTTVTYFVLVLGVRPLMSRVDRLRVSSFSYRLTYVADYQVLPEVLHRLRDSGFGLSDISVVEAARTGSPRKTAPDPTSTPAIITVRLTFHGRSTTEGLSSEVLRLPGVLVFKDEDV